MRTANSRDKKHTRTDRGDVPDINTRPGASTTVLIPTTQRQPWGTRTHSRKFAFYVIELYTVYINLLVCTLMCSSSG